MHIHSLSHQRIYEMRNTACEFNTDADHLAECFLTVYCVWDPTAEQDQQAGSADAELNPLAVKLGLGQGHYTLRHWRDEFYRYEAGRYIKLSDAEMKCWIKLYLHCANDVAKTDSRYADRYVPITSQRIANIMLCLAGTAQVHIPEVCEPNCWLDGISRGPVVVADNGNVYLQALDEAGRPKMDCHSPAYFTLTKLPYDYDPDASCPRWREFLFDVMDGDAERIRLLQQWAGYLLSTDTEQQKFLLIAGDGQNGKTVFTTILEKMVGEDNVSHVPLSQFCNPAIPHGRQSRQGVLAG